jgi:hypothetical protein
MIFFKVSEFSIINIVRIIPIGILSIMSLFVVILAISIIRSKQFKVQDKFFLGSGFLFYALGAVINITYYILGILVQDERLIKIIYAIGISSLFLACLCQIIFQHSKRDPKFKPRRQYLVAGILSLIIVISTIIMTFIFVTYNASTNWAPLWSVEYSLYYDAILLGLILIEVIEANKIYKLLAGKRSEIQRQEGAHIRWKYFNIGFIGIASLMLLPSIANLFLNSLIRAIAGSLTAFMMLFGYIMYKGLNFRS